MVAAARPEDLRVGHVLAVPELVRPEQIERLALAHFPAARFAPDGRLRLTRHSALEAPVGLPRWVARELAIPETCAWAYRLDLEEDRGAPPLPGSLDPTGIAEAFAAGLPQREEGRVVAWAAGVARTLAGALRCHPSGVVLTPDPAEMTEYRLYSEIWLAPDAGLAVCREVFATVRLEQAAGGWHPPEVGHAPLAPGVEMDPAELAALHARADAFDAAAAELPPVLDGYGMRLDGGEHGSIVIHVGPAEDVPLTVSRYELEHDSLVSYRVFWAPADERDLLDPHPDAQVRAKRRAAAQAVALLAGALTDAVGGILVTTDGFEAR